MHECPAPGCTEQVRHDRLACRAHWYSIPEQLRTELWQAYQMAFGGGRHVRARQKCVEFLEQAAQAA